MNDKYFDIERDKTFPCFCQACAVGKTEEQMSLKDIRYCVDCQPIVEEGHVFKEKRDYWDGMVFYHYGKGYGVTKKLQSVCFGSEEDIKKAIIEQVTDAHETPQNGFLGALKP